ncbi:MAG: hypothetical protein DWQ07_06815 [Chloroflexi bacterium]|nr:MAG: hypothetical protein DWQ07_06815 [Chloroflexota bacterium]MBL1195588.1 hypothetical protein [Chloroflexota bacterium]NOH12875.1 hypothetical protein [Chloroflexota bacterium]
MSTLTVGEKSYTQSYSFTIGPLDYVGKSGDIFLHIPELPARGAEGRPEYPEQAQWIRDVLAKHAIQAKEIWWSHWHFPDVEEASRFEEILREAGAED